MKDGFRQTMAFLHSWAGLIPGWLLYAVFLTGSLSYYRQEITQWMQPELTGAVADPRAAEHALAWLGREEPDALLWRIDLPTDRNPVTEAMWQKPEGGFDKVRLDPRTDGPLHVRETLGGDFLYYFHFDLNAPGRLGRWLVCFSAIIMLVAIISGVITHKKIFVDFFTLRLRKGQRSWLDAHNVMGVTALPYHLMITFTGLVTLMTMFMPWAIDRAYSGDWDLFGQELQGAPPVASAVHRGPPMQVDGMIAQARAHWGGRPEGRILVEQPGTPEAIVVIEQRDVAQISYDRPWMRFASSGHLLGQYEGGGPVVATRGWLYGLHLARFSGWTLRLLFFLSGLVGTAMVATGLLLWVAKRKGKPGSSFNTAERLNVAVIAGLPLAISALLISNRIIPVTMAGRPMLEAVAFFLAWLVALIHALTIKPGSAWRQQVGVTATLLFAAPLFLIFDPEMGLLVWLATGDVQRAAIDLTLLALGVTGCLFLAARTRLSIRGK